MLPTLATEFSYMLKKPLSTQAGTVIAGLVFAVLWGSASTATKIGLESAQPFVIALSRFAMAATLMLVLAHGFLGYRLPKKQEWRLLFVYGLLNVGIYLGLYVIALQQVSAGLGALLVATNPVLISLISTLWFRQPFGGRMALSIAFCSIGLLIVAIPLIQGSYTTPQGLAILLLSMASYSAGAIYFARTSWNGLHMLVINGWQTLFGGLSLLPVALLVFEPSLNIYDASFWIATTWLALPVSIVAVLLWQYLLREHPVKASFWLFLCPIAGFAMAAAVLGEPVTWHTFVGVVLVLAGLYIVQWKRGKREA